MRRADRPLLWINILFLLWVALVPFSTALLGEYPKAWLAIGIYRANLIGLTLALHWWYATAESRHVDPDIHPGLVRGAMYRTLMAPIVYLIAIALSFFNVEVSLILYALVPILYIFPARIDVHWGDAIIANRKPMRAMQNRATIHTARTSSSRNSDSQD
jgi:uncharacterized membrane protein